MVIKPSGMPYDAMTPDDMVIVDLNGNIVEGKRRSVHRICLRTLNYIGNSAVSAE